MTAQKSVTEKDNQDEQHQTNHISFFDRQNYTGRTKLPPNIWKASFFFVEFVFFQSSLYEWFRSSE